MTESIARSLIIFLCALPDDALPTFFEGPQTHFAGLPKVVRELPRQKKTYGTATVRTREGPLLHEEI